MFQHKGETITETGERVSAANPVTYLKRLAHGGHKEVRPPNRNAFPVYAHPVSATPEMIEAARLHLEIRANEDIPIDIEEMLNSAIAAARS